MKDGMQAEELIAAARLKAEEVATLTVQELELEADRPLRKYEAVLRVAASGVQFLSGKAHSFSSAEELVESDPVYAEHLAALREAIRARMVAAAAAWALRTRAELSVRLADQTVGAKHGELACAAEPTERGTQR